MNKNETRTRKTNKTRRYEGGRAKRPRELKSLASAPTSSRRSLSPGVISRLVRLGSDTGVLRRSY